MRVYIIGAGPGHPKLLTVRGAELIARCPVILYTGSLVPKEVLRGAAADAKILDSSPMTLAEIMQVITDARDANQDVARLHTGDPLLFSSTAEQMRCMDALGIDYEIVPGVSSFTAAAAAVRRALTLPECTQTVILTRAAGRTPVPEKEALEALGAHRATLALFLSVALLEEVVRALTPAYGADCPAAVVHRASCPDERVLVGTLQDIHSKVREADIHAQAIILVGHVLMPRDFAASRLYDAAFSHGHRRAQREDAHGE